MTENRSLEGAIERIAASADSKTLRPLVRFLKRSGREIDMEDLEDLLLETDLTADQQALIYSAVGEWIPGQEDGTSSGRIPDPSGEASHGEVLNTVRRGPLLTPADPVRIYMNQVSEYRVLSLEEELRCGEQIARGRKAAKLLDTAKDLGQAVPEESVPALERAVSEAGRARELLIERNLLTVIAIAKKYLYSGMSLGDLIQEGNIGLMRAVDRYDYRKGYRFNTYASYWIRQGIQRGIANCSRTIRLPGNIIESIKKVSRAESALAQTLGREPTAAEIAGAMGTAERTVTDILRRTEPVISLDAPFPGSYGSSLPAGAFLPDRTDHDPAPATERDALRGHLTRLMGGLTVREDCMVRLRFGMEDGFAHTLEEVGTEFGLTRERVRQIEKGALDRLGTPGAKQDLRGFLKS